LPPLGPANHAVAHFSAAKRCDQITRSFVAAAHGDDETDEVDPGRSGSACIREGLEFFDGMSIHDAESGVVTTLDIGGL
jgi:hypothetical protein